jgi:protein-S-isoprenylcysteine O-methyltransferase Ste14
MENSMKYLPAFRSLLIPLIPLIGLPLLGWGIDDLRGFFSIYPRLGSVLAAGIPGLAEAYYVIKVGERNNLSKGEESKHVRRQSVVLVVIVLLLFGILFFLPFADRRNIGVMIAGQGLRWLGLVLYGIGLALMSWARAALGRMYSGQITIQQSHQLITTGLYHYIRHPLYLGILCSALGLSFLFRSWIGLATMIPIMIGLLIRIKDEEALMHKEFGKEWEAYCKRSWHLLPYIY